MRAKLSRASQALGWLGRALLVLVLSIPADPVSAAPPATPRSQVQATVRSRLRDRAVRALSKNQVRVRGRRFIAAGSYGFSSMWTRDFAFAAKGLMANGDHAAVRDQLDAILQFTNEDGLVPRAFDTVRIPWRVISGVLRRRLGMRQAQADRNGRLRPQHYDEHGSPSLDSGLMVILAALDYIKATGDTAWWTANEPRLRAIQRHYDRYLDTDGLLLQPKYSDWQDSVEREGKSFYLNLLYLTAARRLGPERSGVSARLLAKLEARLDERFFDRASGLYRSLDGHDFISLDGNLLALDLGFVDPDSARGRTLYRSIKRSPLWTRGGVPGSATIGDYPKGWSHLAVRVAGLTHYHDQVHWSWLIALSAKVAHRMGDVAEADRILGKLAELVERDGTVGEIYQERSGELKPFKSFLYRSADPFTWGAGMILEALDSSQAP